MTERILQATAPVTVTTNATHTTIAATAASDTAAGVVELATTAEAVTGADTTRAVTAAGVKAATDAVAATLQPLDADLTAIAALTTTATGRSLLAAADAAAIRAIDGSIAGIRVEDEGVSTVAAATAINFVGAGVSVTDAGSNEATVTIGGGLGGIVVQEADTTVAAAATTMDFGAGFDITESPAGEANIALDLTEYTGGALPVANGGTGSTTAADARTALGLGTAATTAATAYATAAQGATADAALPKIAGGASVENIGAVESNVQTVAATGATETLDTSVYGVFDMTMDEACTFTFSNPAPSGKCSSFVLILRGAFTPTLPASVDWGDAAAPTYTTPSMYVFTTINAGTIWLGSQVGKAFG